MTESSLAQPALSPRFANALSLSLLFAAIKLVLHLAANLYQAHLGWGYFRDEPYYILCGQHLDWGYVDHGPIVALQARMAVLLFGKSLAGIRMFAALGGALKVGLTGLLAWQLGARRPGQAIAMAGVIFAIEFLALDSFLSMNACEPVFWLAAAMAILRLVQGGSQRWWLVVGVAAGIGCENKPSMVFFLAALLLALLVTPERRILASRGALISAAIAALLILPLLIWEARHQWATYEFLQHARLWLQPNTPSIKRYWGAQGKMLGVNIVPLAAAGLVWLLWAKGAARYRFLAWTYLFYLAIMTTMREPSKEYYLAPVYPLLMAAGGVAWEHIGSYRRTRWLLPAYAAVLVLVGVAGVPVALTLCTPQQWLDMAVKLKFRSRLEEKYDPFPPFFAMRFGWQEVADDVTSVYRALPPADRARAGIFTTDYGTASAINFLGAGRGLPVAIGNHNNYFLWGPQGETGEVMIVVTALSREKLLNEFQTVELVGSMHHPYAIRWETSIYLCRDRKVPYAANWSTLKFYF